MSAPDGEKSAKDEEVTIDSVRKLIKQRDELDKVICEKQNVLKANNSDMTSSLVDSQGFPVADLDLYTIRHARNTIICAENDRKKLTDEIEKGILVLHERERAKARVNIEQKEKNQETVHRTSNKPFAKVDKVLKASPAQEAGLEDGDQIIQFGTLHSGNFSDINQFTDVVRKSVNRPIRVTVLRDSRPKRLELIPREWSGRGVLGCAVLPVSSAQLI